MCTEMRGRVKTDSAMSAELWWRDGMNLGISICGVLAYTCHLHSARLRYQHVLFNLRSTRNSLIQS
jgi:hypothetical protein